MSLLREIQSALLEKGEISPILLKLRFLASRLGSDVLEEWVKHEAEGYPTDANVPDYRKLPVSYTATFSGPFGAGIQNAPIPPFLIEKFAGEHWNNFEMRQSAAAVDELRSAQQGGSLRINASNLMLLLQGKVYKGYACNGVTGAIAMGALVELDNAVRTRVLELTLQLEKVVPGAIDIALGPAAKAPEEKEKQMVSQITNQVVHGNITNISSTGDGANIAVNVHQGSFSAVVSELTKAGISEADASEFGNILAAEKPESSVEPFGEKAKGWIASNINKATDGAWKIGIAAATKVLTEVAMKYYGLK